MLAIPSTPLLRQSLLLLAGPLLMQPASAQRPPLTAQKWSGTLAVPDPVACAVDDQGRVYVTLTTRRKSGDLDIREWPEWTVQDLGLEDISQKKAFFHDKLAPGKLRAPKGSLTDANKDGSVDWKDLTVPTESIIRLTDQDGDGRADQSTLFATDFRTEVTGIAAGVMAHGGSVYSTIAPDLWKLTDADGDGVAEARESLVHGFGHHIAYAGHDMHGLRMGPDGRIYWTIGDKGVNVLMPDGTRVARPHEGCVLRCEPDGTGFEIFAYGLRNVQEIAFDDYGNMFGVDNDADKPGEKERLVYIVEQSDAGWRCAWQYHQAWNPWMTEGRWQMPHEGQPLFLTPPIALSHDGPAGFERNPGTALSPEWRGWFFLNQFPSGKMNALRLEADGASFRLAEDVTVSSGVMGIGMSWGPDGSLYYADWDGGYPLDGKGAVWRVDVASDKADPLRAEVKARLAGGFTGLTPDQLLELLSHEDSRVRGGAQRELAVRGEWPALTDLFMNSKAPRLARIHALWGLDQGMRRKAWEDDIFLGLSLTDADPEIRAQAADIVSNSSASTAVKLGLIKLLGDVSPRVRMKAALTLGRLKLPGAVPALTTFAESLKRADAFLRHAAVTGLAGAATAEQLAALTNHASAEVRLAACLALGRQKHPAISTFLTDRHPAIAAEAAWAIHDDEGIPQALSTLASWLDDAPATALERAVRRAVNANFRLGTPDAAARLVRFAVKKGMTVSDRKSSPGAQASPSPQVEALTLLTMWFDAPGLDRMDGRPRVYAPREADGVRAALQPLQSALLTLTDPALKALALQVMATFNLDVPAEVAARAAADIETPVSVRLAALRLLAAQHPSAPARASLLTGIIAEKKSPAALRIESLQQLLALDAAAGIDAASRLLKDGRLSEQQAAIAGLASVKHPSADAQILTLLTPAGDATGAPQELRLDVVEAATGRASDVPALAEALARRTAVMATLGDPMALLADCVSGGNAAAGRLIALENNAANCVACHRFQKGSGSTVGPPLENIGRLRTREQLLESLVVPAAVLTPGYGTVVLTREDGSTVSGSVVSENPDTITVRQVDGVEIAVPADSVASRTPPITVMPPMHGILTPRQLRDVVAYLADLKSESDKPARRDP